MDFKCFECEEKFSNAKYCIDHLKNIHKYVDGTNEFICIVNNDCQKSFLSLKTLKVHIKKWYEKVSTILFLKLNDFNVLSRKFQQSTA